MTSCGSNYRHLFSLDVLSILSISLEFLLRSKSERNYFLVEILPSLTKYVSFQVTCVDFYLHTGLVFYYLIKGVELAL